MDIMEANLYEDDFLSSIFDPIKDEFSAHPSFYPNLKSNAVDLDSSPLTLSPLSEESCIKVGREGGNPEEDEGFEDFIEEEITEALQKDSDPTLADSGLLATDYKPDPLELYFGSETGDDMLVSTGSKPFTSVTPIPEEILDFDQGVAMESDHHPRHSSVFSDCDITFDLPFSSPPPTATNMVAPLVSPHLVPSPSNTFAYSHVTSYGQHNMATPTPPTPMNTGRQNSELDLICSVIQSETAAVTEPNNTYNTHPNQYTNTIPIDTTNGLDILNLLNSSVPEENYSDFNSFPASLMLGNTGGATVQSQNLLAQLPLNGINTTSGVNVSARSPIYSESSTYSDTRQRSPTPTPSLLAPSPVSSVTTEYSDMDYGKDTCTRQSRTNNDGQTTKKIVDMPFYEFKKILDSSDVSERDKEKAKAIRKRGKNKVAAKHCRQRKLEVIVGLEEEVKKMKGFKAQLIMRSRALQQKIEEDKKKVFRYSQNIAGRHNPLVH